LAAKQIYATGGTVRCKIEVSDDLKDISQQLLHLLNDNDAVITIGGLGPTSDDNTRFAVSDVSRLALELDESSWEHVQSRLKKFGLQVTEANRQQALFPKSATIWKNEFGTANACHFKTRKSYRYLTLGLIEGEICSVIDAIAQKYQQITAYRWHYPYLEIKIIVEPEHDAMQAVDEIHSILNAHIVSENGANAEEILAKSVASFTRPIVVKTSSDLQILLEKYKCPTLMFQDDAEQTVDEHYTMQFTVHWPTEEDSTKIAKLNVCTTKFGQVLSTHEMQTPVRDSDTHQFVQHYFAWQLSSFIQIIGDADE
jgi:hypothetical protein